MNTPTIDEIQKAIDGLATLSYISPQWWNVAEKSINVIRGLAALTAKPSEPIITPDSKYMGYRLGDLVAIAMLYKQNGNEPMDITQAFRAVMDEAQRIFLDTTNRLALNYNRPLEGVTPCD
jgi:hypothetical protein